MQMLLLASPFLHPWTQHLLDVHIVATLLFGQELLTVLRRSLRNQTERHFHHVHASCCPVIALSYF